jgi:hypothetical protein
MTRDDRRLPTPINQRLDALEAEVEQMRRLVEGIIGALQVAVVAIKTIEERD